MYIKLCKHNRNRIVDSGDAVLINTLVKDGYEIICDETGKPKTFDMGRYINKTVVDNKAVAEKLAKLNSNEVEVTVNTKL